MTELKPSGLKSAEIQSNPVTITEVSSSSTVPEVYRIEKLQIYSLQVAGHQREQEKFRGKIRFNRFLYDPETDKVLKPTHQKRGRRERKFYELVWTKQQKAEKNYIQELRNFIPKYFGRASIDIQGADTPFIKLENLAKGFVHVSIMDIKIGARSWNRRAGCFKLMTSWLLSKYCPLAAMGFRIIGMKVYDPSLSDYISLGQLHYPKCGLARYQKVVEVFRTFFDVDNVDSNWRLVTAALLVRLREIERWFLKYHKFMFLSSSLLVLYESAPPSEITSPPLVKVYMIDFAHTFTTRYKDGNYLHGLQNLISCIECIQENDKDKN